MSVHALPIRKTTQVYVSPYTQLRPSYYEHETNAKPSCYYTFYEFVFPFSPLLYVLRIFPLLYVLPLRFSYSLYHLFPPIIRFTNTLCVYALRLLFPYYTFTVYVLRILYANARSLLYAYLPPIIRLTYPFLLIPFPFFQFKPVDALASPERSNTFYISIYKLYDYSVCLFFKVNFSPYLSKIFMTSKKFGEHL